MAEKLRSRPVALEPEVAADLASRFEANLYEAALRGTKWNEAPPAAIELLIRLGDIYAQLDMLREGLDVDLRLVQIRPREPIFHYNLACSHSRLEQIEPALQALKNAIELGYTNFEHLKKDRDLDNLKHDPRFLDLLESFEKST
jgi:tetratricopeptide (TPR) repeat protein